MGIRQWLAWTLIDYTFHHIVVGDDVSIGSGAGGVPARAIAARFADAAAIQQHESSLYPAGRRLSAGQLYKVSQYAAPSAR